MTTDTLELARARGLVGELPADQLPALAVDALVEGLDSPSLRELAGARPSDGQDNRDLLLAAVDEMG